MDMLNIFLVGCAMGVLSAYIAMRTKKDPIFWFIIGFCFSLLGICINILVSSKLFNRMKKNKIHLPKKFTHVKKAKIDPIQDHRLWYYIDPERKQHGPMSLNALQKNILEGKIGKKTFIWHDELDNWKKAQELEDLKDQFPKESSISNKK